MLTCPLLCLTDARCRRAANCGAPQLQFVVAHSATVQSSAAMGGAGVFHTFHQIKKSAKLASRSSQRAPASGSPSTPAAQLEVAPLPEKEKPKVAMKSKEVEAVEESSGGSSAAPAAPAEPFMPRRLVEALDPLRHDETRPRWSSLRGLAQKREEEEKEEEEEDQDDQENEVFYGYGFFYVRLFCLGFGFQANMVEEHVLFRAFFVLLVNVRSMLAALFPVMWPRSSSLRQWHVFCWYAGDAALVVFPSLSSGPDAPHHGRYEPEEQLRSDTVWIILGESFLECFVFSAMLDASVSSPEE